jgi:DNA polymerase V
MGGGEKRGAEFGMTLFALVDCNNFYASCERVFQPHLIDQPIVVLSNNDGCVIARSNEAKALGIPMGAPYFKLKDQMQRGGITVLSSNYALYGDLSSRVMTVLSSFSPSIEVYSIDECFLDLSGFDHLDLTEYCRHIQKTVQQWTGIPVSIGIGRTKTLSKIANRLAKKSSKTAGVLDLSQPTWLETALQRTPIGDVWGIGRRWSKMLEARGVFTALDFSQAPEGWVRQKMGVVGLRTLKELQGESCVALEDQTADKQTVCVSRSFGTPLTHYVDMKSAIATFADMASEKLRKANLVAHSLNVFVQTSPFNPQIEQYRNNSTIAFYPASNSLQDIHKAALKGLESVFKADIQYKKAGVLLLGLCRPEDVEQDLFTESAISHDPLSDVCDRINQQLGARLISLGQVKKSKRWYMTQNHKTPSYTTKWNELPKIK